MEGSSSVAVGKEVGGGSRRVIAGRRVLKDSFCRISALGDAAEGEHGRQGNGGGVRTDLRIGAIRS